MMSRNDQRAAPGRQVAVPAGGVSSPPEDPPAASGQPLEGQEETNKSLSTPGTSDNNSEATSAVMDDKAALWRAAALDLGRRTYFRHAGETLEFDQAEDELAQAWNQQPEPAGGRVSWQDARQWAHDAWDQARTALVSGDAKPSAR